MAKDITLDYRQDLLAKWRKKEVAEPIKWTEATAVENTDTHTCTHARTHTRIH